MNYIIVLLTLFFIFPDKVEARGKYGPFKNYKDLQSKGWKFEHFEYLKDGSKAPIFVKNEKTKTEEMACPFVEKCETREFDLDKCIVLNFCQSAETWRKFPANFKTVEKSTESVKDPSLSSWEENFEQDEKKQENPLPSGSYRHHNHVWVENFRKTIISICPVSDLFAHFDKQTIVYVDDILFFAYFQNGKDEVYSCEIRGSEDCLTAVSEGHKLEECLITSTCSQNFKTKIECK